jgi:hypothetical protein
MNQVIGVLFTVLGIVIAVLLLLVVAHVEMKWRRATFKKRFPPISDDEFLARCAPGANPKIALRVRRIIAEQSGIEYERIYPESSFVNDLDCC